MSKLLLLLLLVATSGCSVFGTERVRHSKTTSLVNFLYPDGEIPQDLPSPTLRLPLRIGLAYIPEKGRTSPVHESKKIELLNAIKNEFKNLKYVDSIEIIPAIYFSNRGESLQQIKQLYQLDVMALVSYDQIVNRNENILAVTYLTIVGNYIFPGSQFKVSTLIDLALIDLESKRLLFRAAGTHGSKGLSAEAYTSQRYNKHQNEDFSRAMAVMQANLSVELMNFEHRLRAKNPNDDIKVVAKKGYDMAFNWLDVVVLLFLAIWFHNKPIQNKTLIDNENRNSSH